MGDSNVKMASAELRGNIQAYEEIRDQLEQEHPGKTAVLSGGELKKICDSMEDACEYGYSEYGDGKFSIKEIGGRPIYLGAMHSTLKLIDAV